MIIVMEPGVPETAVEAVISHLTQGDFDVHRSSGQDRIILGVVGGVTDNDIAVVSELNGVAQVVRVSEPYRLASRKFLQRATAVGGEFGEIGGANLWLAIEPVGLLAETEAPEPAYALSAGRPFDAAVTRSAKARERVGALPCMSIHGRAESPAHPVVFVRRESHWTVERWLAAAERELVQGGVSVVLLEGGTEAGATEKSFDAMILARAKARSHLPILVDVPVIAGQRKYVGVSALAAVGAGADGVILRVFVGQSERPPYRAATLGWEEATALSERLRQVRKAMV